MIGFSTRSIRPRGEGLRSGIRADCHAQPTSYAGADHDAEASGGYSTDVGCAGQRRVYTTDFDVCSWQLQW